MNNTGGGGAFLVLLVEDNPGDALLLREMFNGQKAYAARMVHVEGMGQAEAHLAKQPVDVVLLDLGLPDAHGLEVVRRANAAAPNIPLVVLTGSDDENLATQALKEGAQDYLIKGQTEARGLIRALRYAIERKSMEEAARETMDRLHTSEKVATRATAAMSDFLANMSHEIRTPLNGVLAMAEAMGRGPLPEVQRSRLEIIQTSGRALLALLNDLLDLSQIQSGKIELVEGVVHAEELANGALAFQALVEEKDVSLRVTLAPSARGDWAGDPKRVRQVLHNLISNAVKFTDRGSVEVDLSFDGERLIMRVQDSGIGISQGQIDRIFDRFVQVDASNSRRHGGSGLGLAICHDLVSLMNGEILVESREGVGTTFTVSLPLTRVDPRETTSEPAPTSGPTSLPSELRVLAAEDNPMNQLVLKTLLAEIGISPVVVSNGQEAIEAWRTGDWDIVLMDIQMPVMDGVSAIRIMRDTERREGRSRTPVIALTANAMAHHGADYLAAGMDGVVAKPISLASLLETMDAALTAPAAALHPEPSNEDAIVRASVAD